MVVELPKQNIESGNFQVNEAKEFSDYKEAFDHMNKAISKERQQMVFRPRFNEPLRVALENMDIELWIVRREDQITRTY